MYRYRSAQEGQINTTINISQIIVDNSKILHSTQCKELFKTVDAIIIQNQQQTLKQMCFTIGEVTLNLI